MGKLTIANLKKTIYYLQRNGLRNTLNAARERLAAVEHYQPKTFSAEELATMHAEAEAWIREASEKGEKTPSFSILVPAYRTNPVFLKELVESVRAQIYPRWELILVDASDEDCVKKAICEICDETKVKLIAEDGEEAGRKTEGMDGEEAGLETCGIVRYVRLPENAGISENTNAGIPYVTGNFVGLLDHDDVLTPDALWKMTLAICGAGQREHGTCAKQGAWDDETAPVVLYSDEDKWDGAGKYYEVNRKEDFNLDLLLSNNYICHFLVMKAELFKKLKLRKDFDGAQDYDLVLRAAAEVLKCKEAPENRFYHVPEVLYHWRCHEGSTAENPKSKLYAYEAGRRALQDFADRQGWQTKAENLKHVGFYRLNYGKADEILAQREDLGAIGGKILARPDKDVRGVRTETPSREKGNADGKMVIAGGRMAEDGSVYYEGLKEGFSGYLHRGVLTQDAEAVDLRCVIVSKEFWPLFESVTGVPYRTRKIEPATDENAAETENVEIFDAGTLPEGTDVNALSLQFCKALRDKGKRILWDPEIQVKL